MQAVQFNSATKELTIKSLEIPKVIEKNDILVKVAYSGICGTDLHIIQGEFPCKKTGPVTLGHEFSGLVTSVGSAVKSVKVGDKVAVDPNKGCDICNFCNAGNPHFCKDGGINNTVGIFRNGGWAQYCLVPEEQVHKLPAKITLEQGALCEPLSCLAHGWDRISPLAVGQRILVVGAGIIGNLWVVALHHQGHRKVTVSEPNLDRLNVLKKSGTDYELLTPTQLKQRQTEDSKFLFDVIIDCSGFPPAIEHAFSLLDSGGKLCIFGVAPPHGKISISPFEIYCKELTILGVQINPFTFPKALGLVEAMGDRYLSYEKLGIRVYELKQYNEAIEELKKGSIAKAVFKL